MFIVNDLIVFYIPDYKTICLSHPTGVQTNLVYHFPVGQTNLNLFQYPKGIRAFRILKK